jgi:hypothetical protein
MSLELEIIHPASEMLGQPCQADLHETEMAVFAVQMIHSSNPLVNFEYRDNEYRGASIAWLVRLIVSIVYRNWD